MMAVQYLLVFIASTGHLNGHVDVLRVERFASVTACNARAEELSGEAPGKNPRFVCFPVAAIPALR